MEQGKIHSFETCGGVDGPGIRFVVFFQGCLMRCQYCHNRDTWDRKGGSAISINLLMNEVLAYRHYLRASGGGVTASGGEPTLQAPFITRWFKACHQHKLHTCLDTNGLADTTNPEIKQLLNQTDLVLLDIKLMDPKKHQTLIGVSNQRVLKFARELQLRKQKTWLRYVVVPGYTDSDEDIHALGNFITGMDHIEKIELQAYHELGRHKWEQLGLSYALSGVASPSRNDLDRIKTILNGYGHTHIVG